VARITLSVDSNAVTTINRDTSGTFELLSGSLTDYKGESISGAQLNDLTLLAGYLGDIATAGADPGTIPNMIPTPDGIIGYDDLVVFTMGWNGLGGVKDPISDLGPTTGSVPDLAANPDDKYDVADLLAFTQMISWYAGNIASFPCEGFFSGGGSGIISSDLRKIGDQLTLTINAEGAVNLMCAYLKIDYNPGLYEMVSVKDGGFLSHNADVFFLPLSSPASVELYIARLSGNSPAISGCGKLAEFTFKIKAESSAPFNIYYDLRDNSSRIMDSGNIFDVSGGYPSDYRLEQNYPNPFNAETMIDFQLPSASNVKIEVFNLLGESVKLLLDERLSAGYYKVSWNGRDYNDRPLASGIYFYSIRAGDLSQLKKMILMK
jgi:hypothetical protein